LIQTNFFVLSTKKIKVLRIINRFNIGGPTYNATFLTRFLSDDFETLLIGGLPEKGESDSLHILEEYGVEPILLPEMKRKPNFFSDRKALIKIKDIIAEYKPDIVHTHASKAGALGRKAALDMKVPVVVHTFHGHVFHSYFGKVKTELYKFIERKLAQKSTGIIAISDLQKKELVNTYKITTEKKVNVIPLGFDLKKFNQNLPEKRKNVRQKFEIGEDQVAVAIIGRLAPIKNHSLFLEIVAIVQNESDKKLVFFIVGDGELRDEIAQKVSELSKIGVDIRMTSWIKDINEFNAGMDVICLTSNNEGTPVSIIEAQASQVPVVSTNVGGVQNVMIDNETGFIVPKNNARIFADNLLVLIENEALRNEMGRNGWSFVKERFHFERLVKDMEYYYKELLTKE
jgi:glycosyltransferase involved in cell wall biosynthesis